MASESVEQVTERLLDSAARMDWFQVVCNGGPPCFYLESHKLKDGTMHWRFCGRAQHYPGHVSEPTHDYEHKFISLADLLLAGQQAERERCAKKADALGCKCMCGSEIAAAIRRGE